MDRKTVSSAFEKQKETWLFIAQSLDGFIADENGGIEWLEKGISADEKSDAYAAFIERIDTILMGWNTYHQIVSELSPDEWPYAGMKTYVFTHRQMDDTQDVHFVNMDPAHLISALQSDSAYVRDPSATSRKAKGIWICGGASLVNDLLRSGAIDRFWITVIPVLLGKGIRLFDENRPYEDLILEDARQNGTMVDLLYRRLPQNAFKELASMKKS